MPDATPFTALKRYALTTVSPKSALVAVSRAIEARAVSVRGPARLWVCLQDSSHNTGRTRQIHHELAARGVEVEVYGREVRTGSAPRGVGYHDLSPFNEVAREWNVLLLSEQVALAMAARELDPAGPEVPDGQRRFEWLLSSDADDIRFAAATLSAEAFVVGTEYTRTRPA